MSIEYEIPDYGASFGTNGILNGLSNKFYKRNGWNVFFINILTLIRNALSGEKSKIYESLLNDIQLIKEYVDNYVDNRYAYKIIFYIPEYFKCLPTKVYREPNKSSRELLQVYLPIKRQLIQQFKLSPNNLINIDEKTFIFHNDLLTAPAIALYRKTRVLNIPVKACLISHVVLDYHIRSLFKVCNILLSYTGKVLKTNEDISMKCFKSKYIKLNEYTHYLLGDPFLVKRHLDRNKTKYLTLLATKNKWNLCPDMVIKKDLIRHGFIDKSFKFIF